MKTKIVSFFSRSAITITITALSTTVVGLHYLYQALLGNNSFLYGTTGALITILGLSTLGFVVHCFRKQKGK
ncbi:MAG: hypothetical protein V4686_03680 [Patescibacteria group bacterium]